MAEAVASGGRTTAPANPGLLPALVWRNLWRNGRRTWLTAGGIAFAVMLIVFSMSLQAGSYAQMIDNAASFLTGHVQIQQRGYVDQARFEQTIDDITPLLRDLERQPGLVSVAPRVEAFALVSVDERSFGAQVLGVDVAREQRTVRLFDRVATGRMIAGGDEVIVGNILARNLSVDIGGELLILGSGKEGGVAALALEVVGIFSTGIADLDRAMIAAPLDTVQDAFGLGDEAHTLAIRVDRVGGSAEFTGSLNSWLPAPLVARSWDEVMPDVRQGIDLDRVGGWFIYGLVIIVITFSVVNTFIMTVFERTREFGMLRAIGMRPGKIVLMVQLEAAYLWALGTALGLALILPVILWLQVYGIPLGDDLADLTESFYLSDRLYPVFTPDVLTVAPAVLFVGTQIAALIPSLRIRRLQPVVALRAE